MQITESYTNSKSVHPSTLRPCRSIVFSFSTGHRMTRYEGGLECFTNKSGKSLNKKTGPQVIEQMRALVSR